MREMKTMSHRRQTIVHFDNEIQGAALKNHKWNNIQDRST